ncbi:MAG: T9SS type A sorting domain-containing protein [Candidatus Cloacimonetes bacterium]|nr:T9SS type A sorting domain-containing protein [Candidatus Cloacimonadota bacterium]
MTLSISNRAFLLLAVSFFVSTALWGQNDMPLMAEFEGEHHCSTFGHTLVSLDFNHDGYDDLIVWSFAWGYNHSQAMPALGKVDIYFGCPDFCSATQPSLSREGYYWDDGTRTRAYTPLNLGDLNGDGYDDLGIVEWTPRRSYKLLIFYSGPNAGLQDPDYIIELPDDGRISYYWSRLGDVDGDGFDDIGLSYHWPNILTRTFNIIWGGSLELQTVFSIVYPVPVGFKICGLGDINNDGFHDFSIIVAGSGQRYIENIYFGNSQREFSDFLGLFEWQSWLIPSSRALGDLNGDGYHDFFGFGNSEGMKIWFGSDSFLPMQPPDLNLLPVCIGDIGSRSLKFGDVNGDGYDDVVGANYGQRIFAVWLGGSKMNSEVDLIKYRGYSRFGYGMAVGDFNGDGYDDVAVGAPGSDPEHDSFNPGYLFVFAGNGDFVGNKDETLPPFGEQLELSVYPNPVDTSGKLTIELKDRNSSPPAGIKIYNIRGQLVYEAQSDQTKHEIKELSKKGFSAGVYIVKAQVGKQQASKRFTIMK